MAKGSITKFPLLAVSGGIIFFLLLAVRLLLLSSQSQNDNKLSYETPRPTPWVENGEYFAPLNYFTQRFKMKIPQDWLIKEYMPVGEDGVVFAKGSYTLSILNPIEGAGCILPGQPEIDGPMWVFEKAYPLHTSFGELTIASTVVDIENEKKVLFRACTPHGAPKINDNQYMSMITKIGFIGYTAPENYDMSMIREMDRIVQSIELIQ